MSPNCAAQQQPLHEQTGMAEPVLREILALLEVFAATGETACIDLGGLPLSGPDRAELDRVLGRGEVAATIDLAGQSEIWETAFFGVWRVLHFGADKMAVDLIEITSCPEILRTDRRDASRAAQKLALALQKRNAAFAEISTEMSDEQ